MQTLHFWATIYPITIVLFVIYETFGLLKSQLYSSDRNHFMKQISVTVPLYGLLHSYWYSTVVYHSSACNNKEENKVSFKGSEDYSFSYLRTLCT